jgi:hypothetical protein
VRVALVSNEDFIFASAARRPRNIVDSSAKRLNTISKGTFSTSANLFGQIHRESGRVHFVHTCSPIEPVLATPFRDEWRGDFVFSPRLAFAALDTHQGVGGFGADFPQAQGNKWWAL